MELSSSETNVTVLTCLKTSIIVLHYIRNDLNLLLLLFELLCILGPDFTMPASPTTSPLSWPLSYELSPQLTLPSGNEPFMAPTFISSFMLLPPLGMTFSIKVHSSSISLPLGINPSVVAKGMASGARLPDLESRLCHLLLWAISLNSSCFGLFCNIRETIVPLHRVVIKIRVHLEWCLRHSTPKINVNCYYCRFST